MKGSEKMTEKNAELKVILQLLLLLTSKCETKEEIIEIIRKIKDELE